MHPLGGLIPQAFMPVMFNINSPGNVQTVVDFMAHDTVVQSLIINPMSAMSVQAPPSANILRWRQIDMMNASIQRAVSEMMGYRV